MFRCLSAALPWIGGIVLTIFLAAILAYAAAKYIPVIGIGIAKLIAIAAAAIMAYLTTEAARAVQRCMRRAS
jgi:uncharacterized membrane protein